MARRKFLLRIDAEVLQAVEEIANCEVRSVNSQVEYMLRAAVSKKQEVKDPKAPTTAAICAHPLLAVSQGNVSQTRL